MALGEHQKTQEGRFRRERGDTLAGTLAHEYPEFEKVNPRTKLETLRDRYGVDSLDGVRKALKKQR